jgi:chloramphenicol O-acetyltransferase
MEQKRNVKGFLDNSGKIVQLPQKQKTRYSVLEYLAEKFEYDCNYTEQEVNDICNKWHTFGDYFVLRRELIDNSLLCRARDGSKYWKSQSNQNSKVDPVYNRYKKDSTMNIEFHSIDFENWNRKQYFYYFTKMLPTGYSLSVEVDITNTFNLVKKENKKFFPAYLYLASRLISEQQEFRIAKTDNQLGYYEVLHPSYACFHEDDKTMSNMWTEYSPDFENFYNNYINDQKQYSNNHGILAKQVTPPVNCYMIGMLPWTQFTSYSIIPYGSSDYYFPVLQAGKFFNRDDKKMMPLSISVHHAVADGYHVGLFLEKFQRGMCHPEEWIKFNKTLN